MPIKHKAIQSKRFKTMPSDISQARITVTKERTLLSPVYIDFLVKLSDAFKSDTIQINFNNIAETDGRDRDSEQQWVTLSRNAGGDYIARLELSPYSPSATYQIKALRAVDVNNRELFIEQNDQLLLLGRTESRFSFSNPIQSDITAPTIDSASFSDWSRNADGDFQVDVTFRISDDLSGLGYSNNTSSGAGQFPDYNNPNSGRNFAIFLSGSSDFVGYANVSTNPNEDGSYSGSGTIVVSKYAPSGDYTLQIRAADRTGNTIWGNRAINDKPISLTLANPDQDIKSPSLQDLTLSGSFDQVTGRPVVNFKGLLSDDKSGVQLAWLYLNGPDGSRTVTNGGVNQDSSGLFNTSIVLPIPFTSGKYIVSGMAVDNARNSVWWDELRDIYIIAPSSDNQSGAILTGTANSELIFGSTGNDRINGGAGRDTMLGGKGNDTYFVDNANDVVTEQSSTTQGIDLVQASVSYTISDADVENLTLIGSAAINGTGNGSANTLIGNAANNVLNGGSGADTMAGGAGNDTYVVDNVSDVVTEAASKGTDTVQSSVTYTLSANVENLTLTGSGAINGTGNTLGNTITGNAKDNTLNGGTGADTMIGGLGNDIYVIDNIGDKVTETLNQGTDTVQSSVTYTLAANIENLTLTGNAVINGTGNTLNNILTGNSKNNSLDGGTSNDSIIGGGGQDKLTGGTGLDKFIYKSVDESGVGSSLRDTITDFKGSTDKDLVDLSAIDAFTGKAGDQAFVYIGSNAFTGTRGEVRFSGGILQLNTGTDKLADMEIALTGVTSFSQNFLIL